ncbi:MAG: serine/threonine-protein kinase, partial [bacterium]
NFFIVDYNSLQAEEKSFLRRCAENKVPASATGASENMAKQTLLALGMLCERDGLLQPRSPLFNVWLTAIQGEATLPVTPSHATDLRTLRRGERIGAYEILHEIARGGMGVVYCGRDIHLQRLAAIKLLHPESVHDETQRARLLAEARAISQLQHPHIAMIYAVEFLGEAPCLCMEYVDGQRLDEWAQNKNLASRLEVARQIASALAAAHRIGIIHRDLKPSNVLVATYDDPLPSGGEGRVRGVPKVIDFGVAKAAGQSLTDKTLVTGFGNIVGTLEYMSPEQAEINQLDIDTRCDIYSLGVLLYELLTGSTPFSRNDLEKAGMLEMLRVIREQEPTKPSTKLSTAEGLPTLAANRGTEPAKLTKLVRGELDWIVMKALEKDRNRRYESANG